MRGGRWLKDPDRVPVLGIDVEPLVLLVDDMAMTPDGVKRVKDALRAFVLDGAPPGLEIGILRTGQGGRRTTALTADRDELLTRVEAMQYLARSYHGGPASESGASEPGTQRLEQTFIVGTLGSLNSLLADLRRLPGPGR